MISCWPMAAASLGILRSATKSKSLTNCGRCAMAKATGCAWMYAVLYTLMVAPNVGSFVDTAKKFENEGHHL